MNSLINSSRPPAFCPGCAHDRITHALDKALMEMNLRADQVVIVSDIGCSGLFDTFFNSHAFHGLHGRALTYATGLKMADPALNVIVTMGDGGLGIGGAHLLSTCRRNIDLTLLILNNFNYGMTGGQFSATTPADAAVGSGFLNQLEKPLDPCDVASAAGATYAGRYSTYQKDLPVKLADAIRHKGFSVIDIWGVCPGRYTRRNKLTPSSIASSLSALSPYDGPVKKNSRREYGENYRKTASGLKAVARPAKIKAKFTPPKSGRQEVVILGSAGQRIVTAGEILCLAGLTGGLNATQKNDYPITVLRGHSISELVVAEGEIGYTGIHQPAVIMALAPEGVSRRQSLFETLKPDCDIVKAADIDIPSCDARIIPVDFKAEGIKPIDRALAALAVIAKKNRVISLEMLNAAIRARFRGTALETSLALTRRIEQSGL